MAWIWHKEFEKQLDLSDAREALETKWWERQAEVNPAAPVRQPPVPTRTPRTDTTDLIDACIDRVNREKPSIEPTADKTDIWKMMNHKTDKLFRYFQAERPLASLTTNVIRRFHSILNLPIDEFLRRRRPYRKERAEKTKLLIEARRRKNDF